jgi:hypothetical protein
MLSNLILFSGFFTPAVCFLLFIFFGRYLGRSGVICLVVYFYTSIVFSMCLLFLKTINVGVFVIELGQ